MVKIQQRLAFAALNEDRGGSIAKANDEDAASAAEEGGGFRCIERRVTEIDFTPDQAKSLR